MHSLTDALGSLSLASPFIGGNPALTENWVSPNITKECRFTTKDGSAAVLVTTRIRDDLAKDDTLFGMVEPRYTQVREVLGEKHAQVHYLGEAPSRILEVLITNPQCSAQYPYILARTDAQGVGSVSVSQLWIAAGRLLECSMVVKAKEGEQEKNLSTRASSLCSQWRATVR